MSTLCRPDHDNPAIARGPGKSEFRPKGRNGATGIVVMVGAHVLLAYGLLSGLGGKALEVVRKPLEATIVQEVTIPPPPPPPAPPPPKIQRASTVPQPAPQPPSYVPPPEVPMAAPAAPTLTAVQDTPAPSPAPVSDLPVVPSVPSRTDIAIACPNQTRPVMPARAADEGIEGTVKVEARIRGGRVAELKILSGPKVFHSAVRAAMLGYQCAVTDAEVVATQDFAFRIN